ncbi:MAG: hypothetical protein HY253_08100 [Burkholderiales bacterium]|nr:hypothetical protein [Burkholderiales bacterium]
MKISSSLLAASVSACLLASLSVTVSAQEKNAPPPPKLEKLEEGPETDIKLIKPESNKLKTVGRREGGKVTEVQVKSGKSQYTVKTNDAAKGTREGDANRAAQWKVMEFGGKKEAKESESLPVLPVGPHSTAKTGTSKLSPAASASASASAAAASQSSAASMPPQKDN